MIPFGKRIEPFVDDFLIGRTENASLKINPPICRGKVLGFDEAWENKGSLGMTVFDDGGTVKMYYRGFPGLGNSDLSDKQTACVAESRDGLRFTRVPVNRIPYGEITENNIVRMDGFCHNFGAFLDTNPACRPDEKYKAVAGLEHFGGLYVFGSPDGIEWHRLAEDPVITKGLFDSMNIAFYDRHAGLYRCYSRYWLGKGYTGFRAIQSCTSEDFIHWTEPVGNEYPGMPEISEHFYTNAANTIPGAEHILVSIPMRYNEAREAIVEGATSRGVSDCTFMTSRDGVHWNRTFPEAWIAPGLHSHEWTHRCFIALSGIIERGQDFYLYTMQNYVWDDDGIWCYSVPRYRFASVYAGYFGGSFTTKPLCFESDTFFLNYSTAAFGHVKVTVLDEDGTILGETAELYGNELSRPLSFDGIAGKCGTLRFELRDAHVYAVGSKLD
ncbi:MAG: hypothetical protein IJ497_09925 [Clostridia bacterium]|nr:hypothetical protein [Clostridia bacterium]